MCLRLLLLLWLSTVSVLAAGDHWGFRQRTPTSATLLSAVWTGAAFVATGEHGLVLVSADGSAWQPQPSGTSRALKGAVWTGTRVVAVGDDGVIVTSPEGSVWTVANSPRRSALSAVAWTGTQCVAVGDAGTIATSTDGVEWALRAPGSFVDLKGVAATSTLIVSVGAAGSILTSATGATWSSATSGTTQQLNGVARGTTRWVAVGDRGTVLSSSNGTTWSAQSSGVTVNLQAVHWDGTRFVAVGVDGVVIHSTDGLAWTSASLGNGTEMRGLTSGNGTLLAVGADGSVATSATAESWISLTGGSRAAIHDLIRAGGQWVAVGEGGNVLTSSNGDAWTAPTSGITATLNGVAWSGSLLVAVGDSGAVVTSPDGVTWTTRTSGTSNALLAVAFTGTQFIAVGAGGIIRVSANGTSWSGATSGTAAHLRSVTALSASQIVAVGDGGVLLSSTNGSAWTVRTSGVTTDLNGVTSAGTLFVAGGAGGRVITSSNMVTWTLRSTPLVGTEQNALHGVRWTGDAYLATGHRGDAGGPGGRTLQSADGITWTLLDTQPSPPLTVAAGVVGQTLLAGMAGTVLGDSVLVVPVVQFQVIAATVAEGGGAYIATVEASSMATSTFSVPLVVSGTATAGADATISSASVMFVAGQTTGTVIITPVQDAADEADETLVLTLQPASGATLGANTVFTLTIIDDDVAPVFVPGTGGEVVPLGTAVELAFEIGGSTPTTYQWLKNGVAIAKATAATYKIPVTTLSSAGSYRLRVTAPGPVVVESPVHELAVVDLKGSTVTLVQNKTASFSVSAAGNGLTYLWQRDGIDLPALPRITGATLSKVTISALTGSDAGTYRCRVGNGFDELEAGSHVLVVTVPPVVAVPVVGPLMVSQPTVIPILMGNAPTKVTVAPLPSGLVYDAALRQISGRPLVASGVQPFQVVIKATNAAGSSVPVTLPLTVLPLPASTAGVFQGTIDRQASLTPTSQLGGRLAVTIAANGKATGSITLGSTSYAFTQPLDTVAAANPTCSATIVRKGLPSLRVNLALQGSSGFLTGTVSDGVNTAACRAWLAMSGPFTAYTGYYTSGWKLANAGDVGLEGIPQGHGYAFFTVNAAGTASGTMRLSDGTQIPLSAALRSNGALVVFSPLYAAKGSLLGTLNVTAGSPALVSTEGLDWMKQVQTVNTRSYKAGFDPVALTVTGARYTAPVVGSVVMQLPTTADNVPNAALEFTEGGAPDPASRLDVMLRYSAPAVRDLQTPASNPGKVSVVVNAATGLITGSFTLTDPDTTTGKLLDRKVSIYGLISRDVDSMLRGYGHFQLPQMPNNLVIPATSATTSPILSGGLRLRPWP